MIEELGEIVKKAVDQLYSDFKKEVLSVDTSTGVQNIKVKYLGRKGPVQEFMKKLKECSSEERPLLGKVINDFKQFVEKSCIELQERFIIEEETLSLQEERVDVTLPGKRRFLGRKHIITQMLEEVLDVMISMGFSIQYGPDIETDYYNFESLNFDKDHPARDMQDTFYISPDFLLRTHTSNVQVRVMESSKPPIRIVAPGKCYRNESITARSHVFFHQVEALYVADGVTFSDLLGSMKEFFSKLFSKNLKTRFRPSYFPFVEPGMEVDIHCLVCNGKGCGVCKHTGWLEIAGAGMVHPEVLKNGGIDPEKYTGYAWGLGIERLVMMKYGIKDIRMFTENDIRFLEQCS